ncbi:MAG: PEP-CTERM sorting domain-containing protein [Trichodesmium sp.]
MRSMISAVLLSATATIVAVSIQVPVQAAKLMGSFDWNAKGGDFTGEATFMLDKDSYKGMIDFDLMIDGVKFDNKFDISNPMFGEEWELEMFDFKNDTIGEGKIDLMNYTATFELINDSIETPMVTIQNVEIKHVPEPTSTLSLLALGTLGAASALKHKLKSSKSTDKGCCTIENDILEFL